MSYILEALKKAQAERQIGEMPTIHAPTMAPVAPEARGIGSRKPMMLAFGLLGGAVVVLGAMLLRQPTSVPVASVAPAAITPAGQPPASPTSPTPAAVSPGAGAQPVGSAQPSASPTPSTPAAVASIADAQPSASSAQRAPVALPVADGPVAQLPVRAKPSAAAAQASDAPDEPKKRARETDSVAARAKAESARVPATVTAPATPATPAPPAAAAATASEEHIQSQRELPEPIQRAIPQISMGGYMYSKNPADRLILIDKVLRKEGDEVAPGLQLEKLMPKAAVFSFRGYRYKVPL